MQRIAVSLLAWDLTHSPTWLGIIAMTEFFLVVFMGPIEGGGVLADRFNNAANMIVFQSIAMIANGVLFLLMLAGLINIWLVALLTLCVGIASGLHSASRLALAPSLVPKEHLITAIAMNSMMFNTAHFIGTRHCGDCDQALGGRICFCLQHIKLLNPNLGFMNHQIKKSHGNVWTEMKEGPHIVFTNPGSKTVIIIMLATVFLLRPIVQLLPGIADEIYHSGVDGFAYLTAAIGGGAIIDGYWMAQHDSQENFI